MRKQRFIYKRCFLFLNRKLCLNHNFYEVIKMKKNNWLLAISLIKYVVLFGIFSILIEHIVEQLFIIKVLWFTIGEPF